MTKKLTINDIKQKINNIENNYYKDYNQSEEWWRKFIK